jgi:hypothetical protein
MPHLVRLNCMAREGVSLSPSKSVLTPILIQSTKRKVNGRSVTQVVDVVSRDLAARVAFSNYLL